VSVSTVTTLSAEQAALRPHHVGGSEVAALFDLHPFLTRFELWHRKKGNLPEDDLSDNDRVFWGTVLEPAIGAGISERTGWPLQKVHRYAQHPSIAGMGASPDFEILDHPRGRGLVQVKNIDGLVFRQAWEDGKPPIYYQLQLQHELACTGYSWGALGVLIGGNKLEIFDYPRHEPTISKLEREVASFWQSIAANDEPHPDFERDLDTIRILFGSSQPGKVADLTDNARLTELCQLYKAAGADEKSAAGRKDAVKAEILTIIGDAEIAFAQDFKVSAGNVEGGPVSYVRKPYRDFRIFPIEAKPPKKKGAK